MSGNPESIFSRLRSAMKREKAIVAAILLVIAGLLGFIKLADEIVENETQSVDVLIDSWLHAGRGDATDPADPAKAIGGPIGPIGPGWLVTAAIDITALGGPAVLTLVVVLVAGYLAMIRDFRTMMLVIVATVLGLALSNTLKLVFARPRPQGALHLVEVSSASFPSGHATLSAVVYLTLGAALAARRQRADERIYIMGVAILLTALIGISRVYLGVHYPTDVLAGWSLGLAWSLVCLLVAGKLSVRLPVHATGPASAGGG